MDKNDETVEVEETFELPAEPAEGEADTTDYKAEAQRLREKAISQRERTKVIKKERDEAKEQARKVTELLAGKKEPTQVTTGGLDETALDYLDLKGVSENEDIKVIEDIVKRTGLTVRQALKDEYVAAKLASNKANREVKDATPSSTRRSGGNQGNDLATHISKYEQSGFDAKTLPDDFALRSAVINAVAEKNKTNKPGWH